MMKNSFIVLALGLTMIVVSPTIAQESTKYAQPGLYLGIGGIYAIEGFEDTASLDFNNNAGFNFRLGYRFHPRIAVEAMGERVDAFDLEGSSGFKIDTWTGTLNGKFFALTERFQPYGLLGIGAMRAEAKVLGLEDDADTGVAFRYGAGMDSYITENWVFNVEISKVRPTGEVNDINYYSIGGGIQYRF